MAELPRGDNLPQPPAELPRGDNLPQPPAVSADLYRTVRLIRRFEQRAIELVRDGVIPGGIHPYIGEEAIAAGACAALRPDDLITSTHRGHGHVLAKGADPVRMLAELAGRETGLNGGRGGSMHTADVSAGIYGANAIVGASAAIAAGAAWSHRHAGHDRVAVTFFGDGAVNQGVLLEALNLASLRRLPVIFVCENNQFATSMRVQDTTAGTITGRARAFGIPAETIDGMDAEAVLGAASGAVARARAGEGPTFLECLTYRFDAHHTWEYKVRPRYRTDEEVAAGRARDPLEIQAARVPDAVRARIDGEIEELLDQARRFVDASPEPDPSGALDYLYAGALRGREGTA
jgi:acetoin:2,6-dichlorophenolindophenol oxidoreductase subunit alpha